jgi:hypothetical protein
MIFSYNFNFRSCISKVNFHPLRDYPPLAEVFAIGLLDEQSVSSFTTMLCQTRNGIGENSMKTSQLLKVTVGQKPTESELVPFAITAIHPEQRGITTMHFVGASCTMSAQSGMRDLTSITGAIARGKAAVIALVVVAHEPKGPATILNLLLSITWEGDKLLIDFDRPFVPLPDRVAQVCRLPECNYSYDLLVSVGDKRFASCTTEINSEFTSKKLVRIQRLGYAISDTDLLCRLLVGEATIEQVEEAVIARPIDVAALQAQVTQLDQLLATERLGAKTMRGDLAELQGVKASQAKELAALEQARREDMERILSIIRNDGKSHPKARFGLPWVSLARVRDFVIGCLSAKTAGKA